jgi:hypothetical protein
VDRHEQAQLRRRPRFSRLPERFINELKRHEPTGIVHGDTWHEVQFLLMMGGEGLRQASTGNRERRVSPLKPIKTDHIGKAQNEVNFLATLNGGMSVVLAMKKHLMMEHPGVLPWLSVQVDFLLAALPRDDNTADTTREQVMRLFFMTFMLLFRACEIAQEDNDGGTANQQYDPDKAPGA